jgi:hypothetical protein
LNLQDGVSPREVFQGTSTGKTAPGGAAIQGGREK